MANLFGGITSQASGYSLGASGSSSSNISNAFASAFSPAFSSVSPFASGGSGTWAIGMIMGMYIDESNLGYGAPSSMGYAMVDLSVANTAVSTAAVTLVPSVGSPIPLSYLASSSYNGYNFSFYGSGSVSFPGLITYQPNVSYTMTVANIGGTATSSLTAPGGFGFAYNSGEASVTITDQGPFNAAILYGFSGTTGALTYQSTSPSGNPFTFPTGDYSLSSPATYLSLYETVGWTTTVNSTTGVRGGLIGVDMGMAELRH